MDQSYFKDDNTVINFMEGLILVQDEIIEPDPKIMEYIDFDTTTCTGKEQLFIHNLFKLSCEKKLFTID